MPRIIVFSKVRLASTSLLSVLGILRLFITAVIYALRWKRLPSPVYSEELSQRNPSGTEMQVYDPDSPPTQGLAMYERLREHANQLRDAYEESRSMAALDRSIRLLRKAVSLCPPSTTGIGRDEIVLDLACMLLERYDNKRSPSDLEECIECFQESVTLRPPDHPKRIVSLNNLASAVRRRYDRFGKDADLMQSIDLNEETLALCPPGHVARAIPLGNLSAALSRRYARFGKEEDLTRCIVLNRESLSLCPPGHPDRALSLNNLTSPLKNRYSLHGKVEDLEECVVLLQEAIKICPPDLTLHETLLSNLASLLGCRYDKFGNEDDLTRCIDLHRESLACIPPGHPFRDTSVNNLARALNRRYDGFGKEEDLAECIDLNREALTLCSPGHPSRGSSLNNLACALRDRHVRFGRDEDLTEYVELLRESLTLRPTGHPLRGTSLNNLALAFSDRYDRHGDEDDLTRCIDLNRESLSLCPQGQPGRDASLNNLAIAMGRRYHRFGKEDDLTECINLNKESLDLCPTGHPSREPSLSNLGSALIDRYDRFGKREDLDQCIELSREALTPQPIGHPSRDITLSNLANALGRRYTRFGEDEDLTECIELNRESLTLRPQGHPTRDSSLANLATALGSSYTRSDRVEDLIQCIELNREALELRPPGHQSRDSSLNNLASALSRCYDRFRKEDDLTECIDLNTETLSLCPPGHPTRGKSVFNLANAYGRRYVRFKNPEDLQKAFDLLESEVIDISSTETGMLRCALQWINLAEGTNHDSLGSAFKSAIACLQRYLSIGPTAQLQYEALLRQGELASLPMDAAAYFISRGKVDEAVALLDQGRGLLMAEMRRLREPLSASDREKIGTPLSSQYQDLRETLRNLSNAEVRVETFSAHQSSELVGGAAVAYGELIKEKRAKIEEYNTLLRHIRQLPGCADFQRASKFEILKDAAKEGPVVVINCSKQRSDIIIIFSHRIPLLISLNDKFYQTMHDTYDGFLNQMSALKDKTDVSSVISAFITPMAKQLWNKAVRQVVVTLQGNDIPEGSRIWWCPTSFLTSLPFHAAGNGSEWLIDHYVSSYTPTLSALISARQAATYPSSPRILVVAQTKTSGLKNAGSELREMQKLASFQKCLDEEDASPQSVGDHLPLHDWAHFICHGTAADNPFDSYLHLYNGSKLMLKDIIKLRLTDAKFAFLAACHSAAQSREKTVLRDEILHLAAAMQVSGFRSVVGTMWQMEDEDGPRMARKFYEEMFNADGTAGGREVLAARALWKAVRWLKDESVKDGKESSGEKRKKKKKEGEDEDEKGTESTKKSEKTTKKAKKKEEMPMARWANYIHIGA